MGVDKVFWNLLYLDDNAKLDGKIVYTVLLHDYVSVC